MVDNNFKPNWKTTEFLTTCLEMVAMFGSMWLMPDPDVWSGIFAAIVSGYVLARGMFKKSRGNYMYRGEKTTEFIFYWIGMVVLILNYWKFGASLTVTMVCMAAVAVSYKISRGHAKGYLPPQTRVMNF